MESFVRYQLLSRDSSGCTKETCPASASIYGYAPSLYLNVAFTVGFLISAFVFYSQTLIYKEWRFFSLALAVGCLMEAGGYVGRVLLHNDPFSDIGFKLNIVFLTIAPAFLSAAIYVTLKRITTVFGPRFSRLPPQMYTYIFVGSDCVSMLLQGAGGAISAVVTSQSLLNIGVNIMIAGLAFQVFTLLVFFGLVLEFSIRCVRDRQDLGPDGIGLARSVRFRLFVVATTLSFMCIFTRCCYRVAELSGGWGNPIMRKEAEFIILDSDMCTFAAVVLNVFHPGLFFKQATSVVVDEMGNWKRENELELVCRSCQRDFLKRGSVGTTAKEMYAGGFF